MSRTSKSEDPVERTRTEEVLRSSEEKYRHLFNSIAEGFVIIEVLFDESGEKPVDYRFLEANPAFERLLGLQNIVGKRVKDQFSNGDASWFEAFDRVVETGESVRFESHLVALNSWFELYVSRLGGPGNRCIAVVFNDITERKLAEERQNYLLAECARTEQTALENELRERTAELVKLNEDLLIEVNERTVAEVRARRFMRQLVTAQEDERRNIARDLHDHLGQQLTGLRLKLQNHKDACGDDQKLRMEVEELQVIAERVDEDLDFLEWELRPTSLDEFGLAFALANFVQEWSRHFNIPAEFHTTGFDTERLPAEVEINLYRIAQEAMNNISKHAKARAVDVLLERRNAHVTLIIEDDGRGFDPEVIDTKADGKKAGLLNMRERASFVGGTVDIESHPGNGTTVFVRTPISSPESKQGGSYGDD